MEAFAGQDVPLQLVFSPMPFGDAGTERVGVYWQALQSRWDAATDQMDDEKMHEIETRPEMAEPIIIPALPELALASSYPVLPLLSNYTSIADVVDKAREGSL